MAAGICSLLALYWDRRCRPRLHSSRFLEGFCEHCANRIRERLDEYASEQYYIENIHAARLNNIGRKEMLPDTNKERAMAFRPNQRGPHYPAANQEQRAGDPNPLCHAYVPVLPPSQAEQLESKTRRRRQDRVDRYSAPENNNKRMTEPYNAVKPGEGPVSDDRH